MLTYFQRDLQPLWLTPGPAEVQTKPSVKNENGRQSASPNSLVVIGWPLWISTALHHSQRHKLDIPQAAFTLVCSHKLHDSAFGVQSTLLSCIAPGVDIQAIGIHSIGVAVQSAGQVTRVFQGSGLLDRHIPHAQGNNRPRSGNLHEKKLRSMIPTRPPLFCLILSLQPQKESSG